MPSFQYEAFDINGQRLSGLMDAGSRGELIRELNQAGLLPISAAEAQTKKGRSLRDLFTPEPSSEEITAMTLDVVMLLQGGVTLSEALIALQQMGGSRWRSRVLRDLQVAVSVGHTFSRALSEHPKLFPPIYIKMVEVAEATGRLEAALAALADERQRIERMRKRLIGAIAYPAFLIISALAAMTFIFLYVIPQFETALEGFRDKIDPTALMVFNMSAFLRRNLQALGVTVGLLVLGALLVGKAGTRRGIWVSLLARLPFLRTLFLHDVTSKFCRTTAVLTGNGVDITTSLRLVRDVVRLPRFATQIDGVVADVRKGRRLSEALETREVLPRYVVRMLRIGEESGRLPESASRVAAFYESRLDSALSRVIAVLGPATMMLVSVLIAWLIISIMTALMSINDLLK